MRILTLALLFLFILPAWASEPGQPLDCSDMVFHVPGLTCTVFVAPSDTEAHADLWWRGSNLAFDNLGRLLFVRGTTVPVGVEILRRDTNGTTIIATISPRQSPFGWDVIEPRRACPYSSCGNNMHVKAGIVFDSTNGRLLVHLASQSDSGGGHVTDEWIAAIDGFATTFEIMQTYTPASGLIGLRVPYMPEGFQYADYFDTYWGDLSTVGDWTQAQPLQCGYPATPPSVGDHLTVEDTLPTPAPGRGYYYVTAVNYQGQRRYGRQSNGGVLSGRDPAVLPECQ